MGAKVNQIGKQSEIVLSHTGKLGDFLYCLQIASWLTRIRGCKIHWVLPSTFNPFNYISDLLMMQPFTSRVSIVPFKIENFDCGGQPYKFNPADFGIEVEYYNFGFRHYPDKYVSAFYAEEHGFGYDVDYRIKLWSDADAGLINKTDEVLRSSEGAMAKLVPHAIPMGTHEDLLTLTQRMQAAKEVHTWFCGLAILCWMSSIPVTVHRVPGHAWIPTYYEGDYSYVTFVEHQESEVR